MDEGKNTAGDGDGDGGYNPMYSPPTTRDWSDLTPVLLVNVFRRLSLQDRWKGAMLACRSWLEASRDASLFSSIDLDPYFDVAGSAAADSARWWTGEFERRIDTMLRVVADCGGDSLREVRVRHCSDRSLNLIAQRYNLSDEFSVIGSR